MILIAPKLLSLNPDRPLLNNGAVVCRYGLILAVGPASKLIAEYPGHRVYRLNKTVLMPGLINIHAHLELPALLNQVRSNSFPDWIINLIRAKKDLSNKDYQRATRTNINMLIKTGTTAVGEICTHGSSPSLLKQSGLRGIIFHEIISMNPLSEFPRLSSIVCHPSSLMQSGISPHSPYTVSQTILRQVKEIAQKRDLKLSMHIAESKEEERLLHGKKSGLENLYRLAGWDLALAPRGDSSVKYLKGIGFLLPNLLAVHAVQITDEDIVLIKKSKVSVAHCPRSNKETGVGRMPLKKLLDAGITVGLGTDSLASSPSLNMWDEMRFAYHLHRRDGITAKEIFDLATIGGAKALGLHKEIGTLEPGKKADIIAVPIPKKNTGNLHSDLLRETKSCTMTMVNGKILHKIW